MTSAKSAGEPPKRMHIDYLAAAASDGNFTREKVEEYSRLLRGRAAELDNEPCIPAAG